MKPDNLKDKIFVAAQIAQAQGEAWAEWILRTYSCDMDCGDPDNDTTEMIGGHWRDCNVNYQPKGGLSELHDRWVSEGGDPGRGPSLSSKSDHVEWSIDFGSLDFEVGNPLFCVSIRVGSCLMSRWSSWDPEMWSTTSLASSIKRSDQKEAIRLSEAAERTTTGTCAVGHDPASGWISSAMRRLGSLRYDMIVATGIVRSRGVHGAQELEAADAVDRWAKVILTIGQNLEKSLQRVFLLESTMTKISEIRDIIVGSQSFNWSEHAYPLVDALKSAGYPGVGYKIARENLGTLLDRIAKLETQCSVDPVLEALHIRRDRIVDRIIHRFMEDKPDDADVRELKLKSLEIHDLIRARNPDEDDKKVKESGRDEE